MRYVISLVLVLFLACSPEPKVSRFDPAMLGGLCNARTALNSYVNARPHAYSQAFYAQEKAALSTLLAQARNTPLNDSALIGWLIVLDSGVSRLEQVDLTDTVADHLTLFRDVLNSDFDVAIFTENIKKQLPK